MYSTIYVVGHVKPDTKYFQTLKNALVEIRQSKSLDFAGLMVTDIVRGSSIIILDNPPVILEDLPFNKTPEGAWYAEGLVSRKKTINSPNIKFN